MEQSDLLASESPKAAAQTGNTSTSAAPRSNNKPPGGVLPPGAVPSQNGVLSKHAAEFWFPEARNCPCCSGFKHGCGCCKGGVDTCTNASCLTAEPAVSQSASAPAPTTTTRPTPTVSKVSICLSSYYLSFIICLFYKKYLFTNITLQPLIGPAR